MVSAAPAFKMSDEDREALAVMANSSSLPYRCVVQASGLLLAADGTPNAEIARRCETTKDTVRRWRTKFESGGLDAVGTIAAGRGRKLEIADSTIEAIVSDTLHTVPDDGSVAWSTRTMAERHGVGKDTVQRIWKARNLRPWRTDIFKLSNDPFFEDKLRDVVGLMIDPPEWAVVFSFDEKTQCQALDRTQPSLPIKPGRGKTMTHDYKRNGTTDLFAAMNIATGEVLAETRKRHAGEDVLAFFKQIDQSVDRELEIHVVLDNLSAHKAAVVKNWLARPAQKDRWHLHFTPTSSSWLNLIEGWFSILTRKALKNASFTSVPDLEARIEAWTAGWNKDPNPFVWTKSAEAILAKVGRGRAVLNHQTKSATHH